MSGQKGTPMPTFHDPADTYRVFDDLVAGVRSLRQVFDQLANAHLNARDRAFDDNGNLHCGCGVRAGSRR
ncbi:hypothetical protein QDX21_01650 [Auritidibacter ignavus]|uniref:Uncharacterized protein n=1 Tax=Auritidibacter ignavus TaxID=678932 RepID=A0AAJ6DCV6_9MICC|nr:hypothetical protein [Auritidibacter ignavus]WGH93541.1 hypothetical protein QDX21_01650 [Auritidibacter ignavus]